MFFNRAKHVTNKKLDPNLEIRTENLSTVLAGHNLGEEKLEMK